MLVKRPLEELKRRDASVSQSSDVLTLSKYWGLMCSSPEAFINSCSSAWVLPRHQPMISTFSYTFTWDVKWRSATDAPESRNKRANI